MVFNNNATFANKRVVKTNENMRASALVCCPYASPEKIDYSLLSNQSQTFFIYGLLYSKWGIRLGVN